MKKICGTFDLRNDSSNDISLYLEPEGTCFLLPPGKVVLIKIYGEHSMEMQHGIENNRISISMWLENDGYEVWYEGRDILDWISKGK